MKSVKYFGHRGPLAILHSEGGPVAFIRSFLVYVSENDCLMYWVFYRIYPRRNILRVRFSEDQLKRIIYKKKELKSYNNAINLLNVEFHYYFTAIDL